VSETEPDETGGESILSVFRHHADEVGEALFMHIMVANDGAPRHLESVQGPADHSIGGVAAIIRNIAGKKGEADRIGEGGVDLGKWLGDHDDSVRRRASCGDRQCAPGKAPLRRVRVKRTEGRHERGSIHAGAPEGDSIHAPSSTKNASGERDPEMHQTKLPDLLHGEERKVWGDGGYQGQTEAIQEVAPQAQDMTCRRTKYKNRVDELQRAKNKSKSSVRAKVEHPFGILKRIFGFDKVRYRGLAKNYHRLCACFALINLYLHRKRLIGLAQTCA
jgi:hypothetical protein